MGLRDGDPVVECNEIVALPGQHHAVTSGAAQAARQFFRRGECHLLFERAGNADRARVFAAMPRVKHDQRNCPHTRVMRHTAVQVGPRRRRQQQRRAKTMAQQQAAGEGWVECHVFYLTHDVHRVWLVID